MNLSLIAALAFFFGLAAASLAVRIGTTDMSEDAKTSSAKPRAQAGVTKAS